jgi:hypothetical protein
LSSLPFLTTGELREQGGDTVDGAGAVPCSVWPATSARNSPSGRHHTHAGEAALAHAAALRVPNRSLAVDGAVYKIVGATANDFVPHVVLELLLTSGRS